MGIVLSQWSRTHKKLLLTTMTPTTPERMLLSIICGQPKFPVHILDTA